VYRRQVIAARHLQQQQLLSMGDPAGAVMISEDLQPSEYANDGYIWLALTHHLLGAGRFEQVRCLSWGRGVLLQVDMFAHNTSGTAYQNKMFCFASAGDDFALSTAGPYAYTKGCIQESGPTNGRFD
jgi:hypothetical protein